MHEDAYSEAVAKMQLDNKHRGLSKIRPAFFGDCKSPVPTRDRSGERRCWLAIKAAVAHIPREMWSITLDMHAETFGNHRPRYLFTLSQSQCQSGAASLCRPYPARCFPCNRSGVFASSATLLLLAQSLVCCIHWLNPQVHNGHPPTDGERRTHPLNKPSVTELPAADQLHRACAFWLRHIIAGGAYGRSRG